MDRVNEFNRAIFFQKYALKIKKINWSKKKRKWQENQDGRQA
jgi:hypothetical protein